MATIIVHNRKDFQKEKPVRLYGKKKTEFRKKVAERAKEICETCKNPAPRLYRGYFHLTECGHVSHIKGYGAGGGDTMDNVLWECYHDHMIKKHGPQWSKKQRKVW